MVGFGTKYPTQVHHRAASIVSIKKDAAPVSCKGGSTHGSTTHQTLMYWDGAMSEARMRMMLTQIQDQSTKWLNQQLFPQLHLNFFVCKPQVKD
ncbi:unnamed protein product [Prunus armeniaca]|uniref:Uncharacterized protein n=1 Tax=Prunus armeniaca TaxID=36596 RepID=A0A6J5TZS8_PRUAR|nr:unnamed protein product [Prunus armeniaca]